MKRIGTVIYKDTPDAHQRFAELGLDTDTEDTFAITLNGTDTNGSVVYPRFVQIDNFENIAPVTITINGIKNQVAPYTRTTFEIATYTPEIGIFAYEGNVKVYISEAKLGIGDGTNDLAKDNAFNMGTYLPRDGGAAMLADFDAGGFKIINVKDAVNAGDGVSKGFMEKILGFIRPESFGAKGDGITDDTDALQKCADKGGVIVLTGQYVLKLPLTIKGGTTITGIRNVAKIVWQGPASGNILQDTSIIDGTKINRGIVLEDFEIDGGDIDTGDVTQIAINFYRTGDVIMRGLSVHGVGGSGIRWGLSILDTYNILVEDCDVWDCLRGDAIQGAGHNIMVANNRVGKPGSVKSNFGDTAIAIIWDFNIVTNPNSINSRDFTFYKNVITGNYKADFTYQGTGPSIQTGIATGPFGVDYYANGSIIGNTVRNCYQNCWIIAASGMRVEGNTFEPAANTDTGQIRVDGVSSCTIVDNDIIIGRAPTNVDGCGILLISQRNVYGASKFDSDIYNMVVKNNRIRGLVAGITGIRTTFEQVNTAPAYVSKFFNNDIVDNQFWNIAIPVAAAPQTGATLDTFTNVSVARNHVDNIATCIVSANGNPDQYNGARIIGNHMVGVISPAIGSAAAGFVIQNKTSTRVSCNSGAATAVVTLPPGFYSARVKCEVFAGSAAFSAVIELELNGNSARITRQSDGANLALTVAGLIISANQTTGGTNNVRSVVEFL